MQENITIGLVYGSAREGRFCDTVADWVRAELWSRSGTEVVIIDPAELRRDDSTGALDTGRAAALVNAADAFIVVTPEYNHGYTAALKELIDSVNEPWHAKPVAFASYGGISGGLRAVEQLRLVFAELHAVAIRDTVSFANASRLFGADGELKSPGEARISFDRLARRLCWWAHALKAARDDAPYMELAA